MAGVNEDWKKTADAHKTAGAGGGIRRSMPYNPYAMAAAGLAVVGGGLWYYYGQRRPEGRRTAP